MNSLAAKVVILIVENEDPVSVEWNCGMVGMDTKSL